MEYKQFLNARNYIYRFNEILNEMAYKMLTRRSTDNITKYFIECMIPHHQAAIYMSENLLKYTQNSELCKIAHDIIRMQTVGIGQMREIYRTTLKCENSKNDVDCYIARYMNITHNMINKMKNSPRTCNINLDFIGEMIPHHEGAIKMCENLLKYCVDPRLKIVADTIIKEQSQGIKELEMLKQNICK